MMNASRPATLDESVPLTVSNHTFLPGDRLGVASDSHLTVVETCPGPNPGVIVYDHSDGGVRFIMESDLESHLNTNHYHWRHLAEERCTVETDDGTYTYVFTVHVLEFPHQTQPENYSFGLGYTRLLGDDPDSPVKADNMTSYNRLDDLITRVFEFDSDGPLSLIAEWADESDSVVGALDRLVQTSEQVAQQRFDLIFDEEPLDVEVTTRTRN